MGASINAYVVYGMRASTELTKVYEQRRSCPHDVTEDMVFCPTCGKKAFTDVLIDSLDMYEANSLSCFATSYDADEGIFGFCLASSNPEYDNGEEIRDVLPEEIEQLIKFFASKDIAVTASDFTQHLVVHYE